MSATFELPAERRSDKGKGASRRLRRAQKIPAILYGGNQEPLSLQFPENVVKQNVDQEAFYSSIIHLKLEDQIVKAVLKDLQRHPSKPFLLHLDLQRVSDVDRIRMHVPLHFVNEDKAPGVKEAGGMVTHNLIEVEVSCLAKDLPEFIEVDMSSLGGGESLHLSDLKPPEGVELVELSHGPEHDLPVVSIHGKKTAAMELEEEVEGAAGV